MAYPGRLAVGYGRIDWAELSTLDFEEPDRTLFPCLDLAYRAGRAGDLAPAWLNAANEVAVAAFLDGRIAWTAIAEVVEATLDRYEPGLADGAMVRRAPSTTCSRPMAAARRVAGGVVRRSGGGVSLTDTRRPTDRPGGPARRRPARPARQRSSRRGGWPPS